MLFVLLTSKCPRRLASIAAPLVLLWLFNDAIIDSCAVHALCVQVGGAWLLLNWNRQL